MRTIVYGVNVDIDPLGNNDFVGSGAGEVDTLIGSSGSDNFYLGNDFTSQSFYVGGHFLTTCGQLLQCWFDVGQIQSAEYVMSKLISQGLTQRQPTLVGKYWSNTQLKLLEPN